MNKIVVLGILSLLLVVGTFTFMCVRDNNHEFIEPSNEYDGVAEDNKIPLYYELGNEETIYTRDLEGGFVEVKLNG